MSIEFNKIAVRVGFAVKSESPGNLRHVLSSRLPKVWLMARKSSIMGRMDRQLLDGFFLQSVVKEVHLFGEGSTFDEQQRRMEWRNTNLKW